MLGIAHKTMTVLLALALAGVVHLCACATVSAAPKVSGAVHSCCEKHKEPQQKQSCTHCQDQPTLSVEKSQSFAHHPVLSHIALPASFQIFSAMADQRIEHSPWEGIPIARPPTDLVSTCCQLTV